MEVFVIEYKDIDGRLDPHFYNPIFLENIDKVKKSKHEQLQKIVKFSNEIWNQIDFFDEQFPYIEIGEIDIETGDIKNISVLNKKEAPSRAKMIVRKKDIIVSLTRPNRGAISFIDESKDGFIASTGFAVLRDLIKENIKKEFLFYALRQNCSLTQMLQRSSGGNYPAIIQDELGKLLIPTPSDEIQQKVIQIMASAYSKKKQKEEEAERLLDEINTFILEELKVKVPEIDSPKDFVINYSEIENRIDPYYYQPHFTAFIDALHKSEYDVHHFNEFIIDITNGFDYRKYSLSGTPYLKVANIKPFKIDTSAVAFVDFHASEIKKSIQLRKGNILLTRKGTYGVAVSIDADLDHVISSEIFKITLDDSVDSFFISAVLNSQIGQIQFDRLKIGAIMGSLSQDSVKSILIPKPLIETQNEIGKEVKGYLNRSVRLKKESTEVIEQAKKEVEKILFE